MRGKEILELRCKLDMTQEEFAAKIGVKPGTVYNWENDKSKPTNASLLKLQSLKNKLNKSEDNICSKLANYIDNANNTKVNIDKAIMQLTDIICYINKTKGVKLIFNKNEVIDKISLARTTLMEIKQKGKVEDD